MALEMFKSATCRMALVVVAGLALNGCVTDQPAAGPVAQIGFQHLPKVQLNVGAVVVRSDYKEILRAPHVEYKFTTSPERALIRWANTRLVAVADQTDSAIAQFIIEDASVIETILPKSKGLTAAFTYEPTARYVAHVAATLKLRNAINGSSGTVRVESERSIEVSENVTLGQREQAWMELVESLMRDFNAQMDVQMEKHLTLWIK